MTYNRLVIGWLLVASLLCGFSEAAVAANAATPVGFDIVIVAPKEVEQLLARHLELQRYREITDLSDEELDRLLEVARKDAQQLLGTLGYFSPDIRVDRNASPMENTSMREVHITVEPGKATLVAEVQIKFTGAIAQGTSSADQRVAIESSWPLAKGQRFTQSDWDTAKQQITRQLTLANYPTGHINEALADIDPDSHQARLHVTLDSGPAFRTGELVIEGLQRYSPTLVQHLTGLTSGSPYRQADLVGAQQRLSDSGYFESVYVSLDTSDTPDSARVLVKLREAQLQKLVLGVGASTDSGPRLSAEHTYNQARGIGWRALSKVQLDRNNSSVGTELTSPPDASQWRWVTSALVQRQLLGTLDVTSEQLRGGRKQISERIDRNLYLQYDRAESVDSDLAAPVLAQSISANYAFAVRYYDSLPFPSSGWGWGAEVGGGTTLVNQPGAYARLLTRWQGFVGLGGDSGKTPASHASSARLSLRASFGAVIAQTDTNLPSTQLFLTGGDNTVRGYALNAIGVTLADGTITAGRYAATGSVEWQRPIQINGQPSDWESALFVDAGAVANRPEDLSPKVGIGAGVRWKSPVGPLQIDLAYGLDARRLRLHMNLGFTF